jgi:hypothetical protein
MTPKRERAAPSWSAALHQLLRFFPGGVDRLPPPQGDALRYTLGLVPGPPPDRFLAGLGLLTLLADRAETGPLVTLIDDAQWIDLESGTALGFAARRLQAERVVMVFAVRDTDAGTPWLAGLVRAVRRTQPLAAEQVSPGEVDDHQAPLELGRERFGHMTAGQRKHDIMPGWMCCTDGTVN